jgi:hypothetical protein
MLNNLSSANAQVVRKIVTSPSAYRRPVVTACVAGPGHHAAAQPARLPHRQRHTLPDWPIQPLRNSWRGLRNSDFSTNARQNDTSNHRARQTASQPAPHRRPARPKGPADRPRSNTLHPTAPGSRPPAWQASSPASPRHESSRAPRKRTNPHPRLLHRPTTPAGPWPNSPYHAYTSCVADHTGNRASP